MKQLLNIHLLNIHQVLRFVGVRIFSSKNNALQSRKIEEHKILKFKL